MKSLTLTGSFDINATVITNEFIDQFMPYANGEFVKVYLFLARHLGDPEPFTPLDIADLLNHTEKDVLRALRYWESQGLLSLTYDGDGELIGVDVSPCPLSESSMSRQAVENFLTVPPDKMVSGGKTADKELKKLLFVAEQYLGKTLTKTDADAITYFLFELGMSADLIEYLVETCVENGHKSIHYIQKVALSWHKDNITTLEQARQRSLGYNKNCYTVLNAFGIKNRGPAASELAFIRKWTEEMGFSPELIREACDRTILAVHTPSFEYADTILSKWKSSNVRTAEDIQALDEAYVKEKAAQGRQDRKEKKASAHANPTLQQRSYDMESLEDKLLKNN